MSDHLKDRPGRDYTVELWRFLFCIAVLGLHFSSMTNCSFFSAGYLGVEFFFLLSGYGIYAFYRSHMEGRHLSQRLYQLGIYIGSRILRLYPLYLLSLLCMLVLRTFQNGMKNGWSIIYPFAYLKKGWAEFLMLQCGAMGNEILISSHWYVAAVFWGSICLLVVLMLTDRIGGCVLCPLLSFGIYSYYLKLIGKIDIIYSYHAVLRGIAGLSLGITVGFLVAFLQTRLHTRNRKPMYVLGNMIFAAILLYMNFGRRSWVDFLVIVLFAIALTCLLCAEKPLSEKKRKLFEKLSAATYPIYLFQLPIIELFLVILHI